MATTKIKNRLEDVLAEANGAGAPPKAQKLSILPPNFKTAAFAIVGTAPFVMHAFSAKAIATIRETQTSGHQAKKGRKRDPKNFDEGYENAKHLSVDGWLGFPASAFRNAMISACRTAGFAMTRAKLSVFVEPDGYSPDGTGLVKITKGEPRKHEGYVRNATGVVDLRARPMIDQGWEMTVRVRYDGDQFSLQDVANLLLRAGMQVGIGEGRPDSKNSAGMGWGTFTLAEGQDAHE